MVVSEDPSEPVATTDLRELAGSTSREGDDVANPVVAPRSREDERERLPRARSGSINRHRSVARSTAAVDVAHVIAIRGEKRNEAVRRDCAAAHAGECERLPTVAARAIEAERAAGPAAAVLVFGVRIGRH